jgi:hypothetical protein
MPSLPDPSRRWNDSVPAPLTRNGLGWRDKMADRDRNPESSIIGRDADIANGTPAGERVADQLSQTTTESTGGNASGTGAAEECEGLDIVFEREEPGTTTH